MNEVRQVRVYFELEVCMEELLKRRGRGVQLGAGTRAEKRDLPPRKRRQQARQGEHTQRGLRRFRPAKSGRQQKKARDGEWQGGQQWGGQWTA